MIVLPAELIKAPGSSENIDHLDRERGMLIDALG
jgi:hypothetical protein